MSDRSEAAPSDRSEAATSGRSETATSDRPETATTVTISYPADLSEWGREAVDRPSFRRYLRKVHDTATVGDEWAEFVGVGCCGDTLDVPLRVEAIDGESADDSRKSGGSRTCAIDDDTTFGFEERAECDVRGGWEVQSEAGP